MNSCLIDLGDLALLPFSEQDWQVIQGLNSLVLISAGGSANYDFALAGQMAETVLLQRAPALQTLLKKLNRPLSRTRLLRLDQGAHDLHEVSFHRFSRQVIYLPILSGSADYFCYGEQNIPAQSGQIFQIGGQYAHQFINTGNSECVILQLETLDDHRCSNADFLESYRLYLPEVEQFRELLEQVANSLTASSLSVSKIEAFLIEKEALLQRWMQIAQQFATDWTGELSYQDIILDFSKMIGDKVAHLDKTGQQAVSIIESILKTGNQPKARRHLSRYFFASRYPLPDIQQCPHFEKPIFIISAPRAGSTLLFETLAQFPDLWTIGEESHELIEDIASLHPSAQHFQSNRLDASLATPEVIQLLKQRFVRQLRNRNGVTYLQEWQAGRAPSSIRFLEKTPKNALRIPFLKAVFPDALFIYLYRDPAENISSLLEGWRSLRFVAYWNPPGWMHRQWSFFLPEQWRELHSESLATIAAYQWQQCNQIINKDLSALPNSDWCRIAYEDLVGNPLESLIRIAHFAGLDKADISELLSNALPVSRLTLSSPAADKWRKYQVELAPVLTQLAINPFNSA